LLAAAVDLDIGGVQIDRDRPTAQGLTPRRGQQIECPRHDPGHAGLQTGQMVGAEAAGHPGRGRGRQLRQRRQPRRRDIDPQLVQGDQVLSAE